jgi:hypothetical protein
MWMRTAVPAIRPILTDQDMGVPSRILPDQRMHAGAAAQR